MNVPTPVDNPQPQFVGAHSVLHVASQPARDPDSTYQPLHRPAQKLPTKKAEEQPAAQSAAQAAPSKSSAGWATVFAVPAGDTLILTGNQTSVDHIPPLKTITLSGIQAPRVQRGPRGLPDDEFGFQSREFTRKMCVGRTVRFHVYGATPDGSREFGDVFVDGDITKNLAHLVVENGWATAKPTKQTSGSGVSPEREMLTTTGEVARDEARGMFDTEVPYEERTRSLNWTPNARELFKKYRGKSIPGVVDQVRDGSAVRVELLPENSSEHMIITLHLAGVQCVRTPMPLRVIQQQWRDRQEELKQLMEREDKEYVPTGMPTQPEPPLPYAMEAKFFVERRLLHRDVSVQLLGVDKFGNFFGSVTVPQGDISTSLLVAGLGKVVGWSAELTPNKPALLQAEEQAKHQRVRLWQHYQPEANPSSSVCDQKGAQFSATVSQVVTGDTVMLSTPNSETDTRFSLASVRAPRMGNRFRDRTEPYAQEAKEFLRKRLIGRTVTAQVEYVREQANQSGVDRRPYATIIHNKNNIAEELVQEGLASIIRHRMDEDRSQHYEALLAAEEKATKRKKGMHGKSPPARDIVDLTQRGGPSGGSKEEHDAARQNARASVARARQYEQSLKRLGKINGVVEYIFSGSRLKVFIPSENCMVSLSLAGVHVIRPALDKTKGDPKAKKPALSARESYSETALAFCRKMCMQRSVRMDVETMDKGGNFIGNLWINNEHLAERLVFEGLAEVVAFSADRCAYGDRLYTAQDKAQKARRRIWSDYDPEAERRKLEAAQAAEASATNTTLANVHVKVEVAYIMSATEFFVTIVGDDYKEAVKQGLAQCDTTSPVGGMQVKKGDILLAPFDGEWYRARVEGRCDGGLNMLFMDFGNSCPMSPTELRPCPPALARIPPLARKAALAALRSPSHSSGFFEEAGMYFGEQAMARTLYAKVELHEPNLLHLSLYTEKDPNSKSLNQVMLEQGYARLLANKAVPRGLFGSAESKRTALQRFRKAEQSARKSHVAMWRYGDIGSDDES